MINSHMLILRQRRLPLHTLNIHYIHCNLVSSSVAPHCFVHTARSVAFVFVALNQHCDVSHGPLSFPLAWWFALIVIVWKCENFYWFWKFFHPIYWKGKLFRRWPESGAIRTSVMSHACHVQFFVIFKCHTTPSLGTTLCSHKFHYKAKP